MIFTALIIGAYLLGAIPFAQIIAKTHGKDLRTIGSGNIGATNLGRALGKKWACFCFALDTIKGAAPVLVATTLFSSPPTTNQLIAALVTGLAAILGHIFPVYLNFKGGKGVATSFGVALGLWPYYTICSVFALAVWATAVLICRYVSLASIIASISFPIAFVTAIAIIPQWTVGNLWPLIITAVLIPMLVVIRHKENLKRITDGTENKIFQGKNKN